MLNLFLKYLAISSNITSYFHQYEVGRYQGGENVTIDYVETFPTFSTSLEEGSIIVDPWRSYPKNQKKYKVIHYGNTRK